MLKHAWYAHGLFDMMMMVMPLAGVMCHEDSAVLHVSSHESPAALLQSSQCEVQSEGHTYRQAVSCYISILR